MAKVKRVPCSKCGNMRPPWRRVGRDVFCKTCSGVAIEKTPIKKPTARRETIKPRSSKRGKLDALYSILRKIFLKDHPVCQANLPGCQTAACEVHHKRGRNKYYLDTTTWMACCHSCHVYIETHPDHAKELGFSELRLSNN